MDIKERAALVRSIRFEMKKVGRATHADEDSRDSQWGDDPRRGDSYRSYSRRRMRQGWAGDGDIAATNARWDRYRAGLPKRRRLRTPRAPRDPGGYVGYTGDWQGTLGGVRVFGPTIRKR